MQSKRYCTKCNSELEILEVDGRPCQVCKSCSCIEPGYVESEKEIVLELQDYFKNELWRVMFVMGIFRAHLTQPAPDAGESAPLQADFFTPADSTSQASSTPTQRR